MVEQFNQLLAFFGITGTPQNFAELVPWLVTVRSEEHTSELQSR